MIFKLHYWFSSAGASAFCILLGVFLQTYTDASPVEIGALFMLTPFVILIFRPIICSYADRLQAHRTIILYTLFFATLCYLPFVIIPFLGPDFHQEHPRVCWYVLAGFKLICDINSGAYVSICDTLVINYTRRIGTEFGIYRVWSTISWIIFGLIIGQVNEVPYLPKYVPAFIILLISSILNWTVFWLWPEDYFRIVSKEEIEAASLERNKKSGSRNKPETNDKLSQLTRSLVPKEVVFDHIKRKLRATFCLGRKFSKSNSLTKQPELVCKECALEKREGTTNDCISKTTQIKILTLLIKRDIRITLYFFLFIVFGLNLMTTNFFYISLEKICNSQGLCNYSSLGGLLQAVMASAETVVFVYVKEIQDLFGRVNLIGACLTLLTIKYSFYGFIWTSVSPYYSLCIEIIHGIVYSILFTIQIEIAHEFANEIEYILPELEESGVIDEKTSDVEKLKLSLSATMQSLMTCASDGIGQGFGALAYGIIIQKYSYVTLCEIISIGAGISVLITFFISLIRTVFNMNVSPKKRTQQIQQQQQVDVKINTDLKDAKNSVKITV